jgi:hypothetical protein
MVLMVKAITIALEANESQVFVALGAGFLP